MQTSKTRVILKRILSVIVLATFVGAGIAVLSNLLTPVSNVWYFRHDLEKINENGGQVDLIFLGASHGMNAFSPSVFEQKMGLTNAINAASTGQRMRGTYHRLKYLLKSYQPRTVVLDIDLNTLTKQDKSEGLQAMLVAFDLLQGWDRAYAILDCIDPENWLYGLNIYRHRDNLDQLDTVLARKEYMEANDYPLETDRTIHYDDKGHVCNKKVYQTGSIPVGNPAKYVDGKLNERDVTYLTRCVDLCHSKGIRVVIVTPPVSMARFCSQTNYQSFCDWLNAYAEAHDCRYYNLNFLQDRENCLPDGYFKDAAHMNIHGAGVISDIFSDVLLEAEAGEDTDHWFCRNVQEVMQELHRVAGVQVKLKNVAGKPDYTQITMSGRCAEDVRPVYRIEQSIDNGATWQILSDWSEDGKQELMTGTASCQLKVFAALSPDDKTPACRVVQLH